MITRLVLLCLLAVTSGARGAEPLDAIAKYAAAQPAKPDLYVISLSKGCPHCDVLKAEFKTNPAVVASLARFHVVYLADVSPTHPWMLWLNRQNAGVTLYPSIRVIAGGRLKATCDGRPHDPAGRPSLAATLQTLEQCYLMATDTPQPDLVDIDTTNLASGQPLLPGSRTSAQDGRSGSETECGPNGCYRPSARASGFGQRATFQPRGIFREFQ